MTKIWINKAPAFLNVNWPKNGWILFEGTA